ncbi:unnamed protein product [Callosobruchus maculatus]|uniref:Uncharacterized protein n=1 Tax=Callosobruchus maculatus TaxID=64391 RepID=A0A653DDR3_CALMS|nr:unnamed protein product [Callosobruchus maculatus]
MKISILLLIKIWILLFDCITTVPEVSYTLTIHHLKYCPQSVIVNECGVFQTNCNKEKLQPNFNFSPKTNGYGSSLEMKGK